MQQIVEIEHGRDLAAEVEECGDELVLGPVRRAAAGCGHLWKSWLTRRVVLPNGDYTSQKLLVLVLAILVLRLAVSFSTMDITLPLDYAAIERILPHRYPFLLVDRITELEPDKRIVGIKNVTLNERYLAHRRGEAPVLPPTILTEAVAQVGAILILAKPENRDKLPFFVGIERVRYRRPVHPGDVVEIEAIVQPAAQPHGRDARHRPRRGSGRGRRHDDVCARPAQRTGP